MLRLNILNLSTTTTSTKMSEPSFQFLDLPTELRCIVYEQLEITTKHYTLDTTGTTNTPDQPSTITLVCKRLPVQILATSKLINTEAMQIFRPKMRQLKAQPMRFLFKAEPTSPLRVFSRSLSRCLGYRFRPEDSSALSEAAQAFSNCCV